jgi:predicted nucleic acid-binding protein
LRLVADSSVIVAVCLSGGVLGRLEGHALSGPAHLAAEVTSSIRDQLYRGEIDAMVAADGIRHLTELDIEYALPGSLADAAFRLAVTSGWAKTYDAEYVALARDLECPLVTLDGRLQRVAAHLATILSPFDLPTSAGPRRRPRA